MPHLLGLLAGIAQHVDEQLTIRIHIGAVGAVKTLRHEQIDIETIAQCDRISDLVSWTNMWA